VAYVLDSGVVEIGPRAQRLAWGLAAAAIGLQIAYPLTPTGTPRDRLTIVTVVVFCAASVLHAIAARGWRFAAGLLAVTAGGGLAVEALGVATGVPFGTYAYTDTLGPQLLGVPLVIPLAWTMMGYPALVVGRRITAHPVLGPLVAGAALATWELFLDPQMVDAGHWTWAPAAGPHLLDIPVGNFIGWFVVATAMMAVLWRLHAPGDDADDRLPLVLYLWTYASSVLAHAVFFGLPDSALVGGLGMGVVVGALLLAPGSRQGLRRDTS
jgi:uncharacterized membrane protein